MLLEFNYTKEMKQEVFKDKKGRELPDWLREADEKEQADKADKLAQYTSKGTALNLSCNYGLKLVMLYFYYDTYVKRPFYDKYEDDDFD